MIVTTNAFACEADVQWSTWLQCSMKLAHEYRLHMHTLCVCGIFDPPSKSVYEHWHYGSRLRWWWRQGTIRIQNGVLYRHHEHSRSLAAAVAVDVALVVVAWWQTHQEQAEITIHFLPGDVFPGKWLCGKRLFRENDFSGETSYLVNKCFPWNDCKPCAVTCGCYVCNFCQ